MVEEHGGFTSWTEVYTPLEQEYRKRALNGDLEHLAESFRGQGSGAESPGNGVGRGGIAWTDIETCPEPSGQPRIRRSPVKDASESPPIWESAAGTSASAISRHTPPPVPIGLRGKQIREVPTPI